MKGYCAQLSGAEYLARGSESAGGRSVGMRVADSSHASGSFECSFEFKFSESLWALRGSSLRLRLRLRTDGQFNAAPVSGAELEAGEEY